MSLSRPPSLPHGVHRTELASAMNQLGVRLRFAKEEEIFAQDVVRRPLASASRMCDVPIWG
jgi:hypothetical protein